MMKKIFILTNLVLLLGFSLRTINGQNINMYQGNQLTGEGIFYDEGGVSGDYPATTEETITLTLCSETQHNFGAGWVFSQLQFNFTLFAIGVGDTLFIYDGNNTAAPLIGAYNSVNSPGVVISTGQCLTFVFYSDGIPDLNGLNKGWSARYGPFYHTPKPFNLSDATLAQFGGEILECNAILYDSGGPTGNFIAGDNTTLVFSSNVGTHVKAERVLFNVGPSAILEIYDGNLVYDAPNARRIGYFKTGYAPPEILISSGTSLSFKFTATGGGAGFQFNITCIPEIYTQEPGESACPKIELGPYVVDGTFIPEDTIVFDCDKPMVLLYANINAPGLPTADYTLQSIPYDPPFAWYGAGMTQVPTTSDDSWLGPKPLTPNPNPSGFPFNFSFYGIPYTHCVPGTNGCISFNNIPAGGSGWEFNASIPNTSDPNYTFISSFNNYKNAIFGVLQDTYPGAGSPPPNSGIYFGHQGEFPCRTFVFSFYRLPQFSCTSDNLSTYQMVMYEGSNIIDIYIQERTVCSSWNTGSGLAGILNQGGNQAVVPPGRNTGQWTTTNEAWRFIPISPLDSIFATWYKDSVTNTNLIPNTGLNKRILAVYPNETTIYIGKLEFPTPIGTSYILYDTVVVIVNKPAIIATSAEESVCPGEPVELTINTVNANEADQLAFFKWYEGTTLLGEDQTIEVSPNATTSYNVIVTYTNNCKNKDTVTVSVPDLVKPIIIGDTSICSGDKTTLTVTEAEGTYTWSTGATSPSIIVSPSETSIYTVDVATPIECITKDTITVYVAPTPSALFVSDPNHVYVENGEGPINFINLSQGGALFSWNFGDKYAIPSENSSALENPMHIYTRSGKYRTSLTVESDEGCLDSTYQFVTVEVPYFFYTPNSFTPNGDGVNDIFCTSGEGVDPDYFEMYIYNRMGNLIFKSTIPYDCWDGKNIDGSNALSGVYVFLIITHDMEGNPKKYQGSVTLIR